MTNTFALAEPDSRCFVKGCDTENSTYQTAFQKGGFAEFAIPYHEGTTCRATNNEFEYFKVNVQMFHCFPDYKSKTREYSKCSTHPMKNLKGECVKSNFDRDKKTSKCQKYLYDQTHYETTIVTDWNMVCQNSDQVLSLSSLFS